ncbi:MAG: putative quinol monooxygenase [Paracoccaceae bacterium]
MIRVTGTIACWTAEEAELVRQLLPEHIRLSRAEPGCLTFTVEPTGNPLVWRLDESFVDNAAFKAHGDRMRSSAWFAATAGLARNFEVQET